MKKQAEAYHKMRVWIEYHIPKQVSMPADVWEPIAAVWRSAWHDVGVYYCGNGYYRYKRNRFPIKHLYFPQWLLAKRFELGKNQYDWGRVIHVTEEFKENGECKIKRKMDKEDLQDDAFIAALVDKNRLDKGLATAFVHCYRRRLIALGICRNVTQDEIQGWVLSAHRFFYQFDASLAIYVPQQPHAGVLMPGQHRDVECLFFAATVFSLLKYPMQHIMKNDAEQFWFALYVCSDQQVSADDFIEYALSYADLYCNFRPQTKSPNEKFEGARFCCQYPQECNQSAQLARWNHLHFPVVFTNDSLEETWESDADRRAQEARRRAMCKDPLVYDLLYGKGFDEDATLLVDDSGDEDEFAKFNLNHARKHLKKLSCLPVLIMCEGAEGCGIKGKNVLSLPIEVHPAANLRPKSHGSIMGGYIGLLEKISSSGEAEFRTACKAASKAAYRDLGVLKKDAALEQHYQAKLLCSVYLAEHYAVGRTLFETAARDTLAYLKRHIAHRATAADFARFLEGLERRNEPVLFHRDDTGIYLHYKQYWPAFQQYCKAQRIVLAVSAARFRKTVLKQYIKPQYQASGGSYLRYDYRKKVDGREAVVLRVDPKIKRLLAQKS